MAANANVSQENRESFLGRIRNFINQLNLLNPGYRLFCGDDELTSSSIECKR